MSFEQSFTPENNFDKKEVEAKLYKIIDDHEDSLINSLGDVPADTALFYQNIKDILDATLRDSQVTDRESFIRALEYRKTRNEDAEAIDYIIKNTRG